jgi:magnesium-protoporphyrin O-methyltransferase
MSCCGPHGCGRVFDARFARRAARRYERRGLDRGARRMVAFLEQTGIEGATVLELGGGVGEIGIELLQRGAARAINLELSPAYESEAERLLRERGLTGRVERRILDLAAEPEAVAEADVVVLNRVVCCYPDYERLLGAAAGRARRLLAFTHPRRNPVSRAVFGGLNLSLRLRGNDFRGFVHPPAALAGVCAGEGFERPLHHRGAFWEVQGHRRRAT